ncbi:hypothetical protein P153DRAFT_371144 [Dothidotthia symphoricarpi CBS 119687]|uniref:Uncharacterized protein n=1 Tax=Dothidotthia symphoricarpi CBS 119687 TaxID=1392245 RepID=A0A6A6A002_9PLEO|nr:uncharacterized protein P153DRAFT_371144 [Dothidotthia symphoricarpi CBS 119687]KAF2124287.1 hypothetical protein P153DRAFT_371144 [Dothidotthia symphoricarpi CBS 119687]
MLHAFKHALSPRASQRMPTCPITPQAQNPPLAQVQRVMKTPRCACSAVRCGAMRCGSLGDKALSGLTRVCASAVFYWLIICEIGM